MLLTIETLISDKPELHQPIPAMPGGDMGSMGMGGS